MNSSLWRVLLPHMMGDTNLPDPETVRAYKLAAHDPQVSTLIAACVSELRQLVEEGAGHHFMHAAVQGAATVESTPAEWLRTQLGTLRSERELVKKEHQLALSRHCEGERARAPLAEALNRKSMAVSQERESLMRRIDAARSNAPRKTRIQELRAAGLDEQEIAALNLPPPQQAEEDQIRACRERLTVLDRELSKLAAYARDPLHDPELVRGLGLDDLVDAHRARTRATIA